MIKKGYSSVLVDGIRAFHLDAGDRHKDYDAKGLDNLYRLEKKHFWFVSRRERILSVFKKYIPLSSRVIEVGAGTGSVARTLLRHGYSVSVGELHLNGLKYAKSYGIEDCYQFDIFRQPFRDEFDAVGMFDVLEHLDDDVLALRNVHEMLKVGGCVALTVPAGMWLWSRDDAVAYHKRRYTKAGLEHIVEKAGFDIIDSRYIFTAILPLLALRRYLNPDSGRAVDLSEFNKKHSLPRLINTLLLLISRTEYILGGIQRKLYGGSILLIAKKR